MSIKITQCSSDKIERYEHQINTLLKAMKMESAFVTDESTFDHFPEKCFTNKAIKKLEKDYKVTITGNKKICDVAEEMYNYRPF